VVTATASSSTGSTAADAGLAEQVAGYYGEPVTLVQAVDGARPMLRWANPAAQALLGIDPSADPRTDPATIAELSGDAVEPTNWLVVAGRVIADSATGGDGWHTATLDRPHQAHQQLRLRVVPLGLDLPWAGSPHPGPVEGKYVVWLRPATPTSCLAEEAAARAELQFQTLGENAPIGILVSEAGARLTFVNTEFAAIAGVRREVLLGTGWLSVIEGGYQPAVLDAVQRVLAGEPVELPVQLATTGRARWAQLRLAPVSTPNRASGFVGTVEDVTERRERETRLLYQASHDTLTGLWNRRALDDALNDAINGRRNRAKRVAVLFMDLDGFKEINDEHGHNAGDQVLIEIARRLTRAARGGDVVARIAGDEFVVALADVQDRAEAEAAAARHLSALAAPVHVAGTSVTVRASIGIAMAADFGDVRALLSAADGEMYEAKCRGTGYLAIGGSPRQDP
jgi:diguanylate cyclase (GGDEF)-like protein/PAS domain S-box-containing protein